MAATSLSNSHDGYAPFIHAPFPQPLQTYYRIFGTLTPTTTSLLILHGGPNFPHNYLLNHSHLTNQFSIPIILYDQIGSGLSTHLPSTLKIPNFWTCEIFISQLHQLLSYLRIERYDVLGSSWGGMLGSEFAATKPMGLRKLVLANAAASKRGSLRNRMILRGMLEEEMRGVLDRAEREGTWGGEEVGRVMEVFNRRFVCRVWPYPEDLKASGRLYVEDETVPKAMGDGDENRNPFRPSGFMANWTMEGRAKNIEVPTLVINGIDEFASGDAVKPFLDEIKDIRLVTIEGTSHNPHFEKKEEYMRIVGEFLVEI